jgi:hypothetical protein
MAQRDSATIRVGVNTIQRYLRPPGDSTAFQPTIDRALTEMEELARLEGTVKRVIIEIDPALP